MSKQDIQLWGVLIVGDKQFSASSFHQARTIHEGWSAGDYLEQGSDGVEQWQKA